MWVEVAEVGPYVGRLLNAPHLAGVVDAGETVPFQPEHVCGYAYAPDELGYDPDGGASSLSRPQPLD